MLAIMPRALRVAVGIAGAVCLFAQEPASKQSRISQSSDDQIMSPAAIAASKQDPAAVERGAKVFRTSCAGCHGVAANGGPGAPDLVRSLLVLDDEKGILIAPVIREGRPDKGMPKLGLSEAQIADVVAWLHVRTYAAGHRTTYVFQNIVTGDPAKGKAYFDGAGGCSGCHSAAGDMAGIGKKYDALSLQSRWLEPRSGRSRRSAAETNEKQMPTAVVTLPNGSSVSGRVEQLDDFTIGLRDAQHQYHSFDRSTSGLQVKVTDPLQAHADLLPKYTDADIHNVTAYLASLK
jgi:cytochrome c oxidase cbb3-type subunit III